MQQNATQPLWTTSFASQKAIFIFCHKQFFFFVFGGVFKFPSETPTSVFNKKKPKQNNKPHKLISTADYAWAHISIL